MSNSNFFEARGNPLRHDSFGRGEELDPASSGPFDVIGSRLYRSEVQRLRPLNTGGVSGVTSVIAEEYGSGVVQYIWLAVGSGTEEGAPQSIAQWSPNLQIQIYVDNATTPVVSCSFRDFFNGFGLGRPHSLPRVGIARADISAGGFGCYRYLFAPYQRYMRIEVLHLSPTFSPTIWAHASVSRLSSPYTGRKKLFRIDSAATVGQPINDPGSIHTVTGPAGSIGQIESVSFGWRLATNNAGDDNPFEANTKYWERLNDPRPVYEATGGEDFGNGAFGYLVQESIEGTTGPASTGTAHTHQIRTQWPHAWPAGFVDNGPGNVWTYRYFNEDIIRYFDGFKWEMPIGQVGQYVGAGDTGANRDLYDGVLNVYHHVDSYNSIGYPTEGDVILDTAKNIIPSWWTPTGSAGTAVSGQTYTVTGASGGQRGIVFTMPANVGANNNWEIEARVRITGGAGTGPNLVRQVYLGIDGGQVANAEIFQTTCVELFAAEIGGGPAGNEVYAQGRTGNVDVCGVLANRGEASVGATAPRYCIKIRKTAANQYFYYYKFENDPFWQPIGRSSRATYTNNRAITLGVYDAANAVFDNIKLTRLRNVTF